MDAVVLMGKIMQTTENTFRPQVPYTPEPMVINGRFRPASTGNMRFNATIVRRISPNTVNVMVDSSIAPYVVYTNEPWVSPKWKGRENPNEGWFERAVDAFARDLAAALGGKLTIKR